MSVQEVIVENSEKIISAISGVVDEIISSKSVANSPFHSIIYFFAWMFVSASLVLIFRGTIKFSTNQLIGILQDIAKLPSVWKKKREPFPNIFFDPFDSIEISRSRIHYGFLTKLWAFFGTQREMMAGINVREILARKVFAISVLVTLMMALFGSFSFVKDLCNSAGAGFFETTFSVIFGSFVYGSIIYAFDISIIISDKLTLGKVLARAIFALIMAVILGTQLNIQFHKEYLSNRLRGHFNIEALQKEISDLEGNKSKAETANTTINESITNNINIIKDFSVNPQVQATLLSQIRDYEKDISILTCMMNGEKSSGNFLSCNVPSNYYGISLNLEKNRGGGPRSPNCGSDHAETNYCKISKVLLEKNSELAKKRNEFSIQTDPVSRGNYISEINKEMKKLGDEKAANEKIISGNGDLIKSKNKELENKIKMSTGSQTDLVREMLGSMSDDLFGKGDGSSYWMISLFFVVVVIDMFAILAKFFAKSEIYDSRVRNFEEVEKQLSSNFARKFNSRVIDKDPISRNTEEKIISNDDKTDESNIQSSTLKNIKDFIERYASDRWNKFRSL